MGWVESVFAVFWVSGLWELPVYMLSIKFFIFYKNKNKKSHKKEKYTETTKFIYKNQEIINIVGLNICLLPTWTLKFIATYLPANLD